jgi:hypothetical protein
MNRGLQARHLPLEFAEVGFAGRSVLNHTTARRGRPHSRETSRSRRFATVRPHDARPADSARSGDRIRVSRLAAVIGSFANGILDRRHTRDMARTDRSQTRLEHTYLELISYVHRSRVAANNIRPFVTYSNQPQPVTVTVEETQRAQALVAANASPKVRDILDEFGRVLASIHSADTALTGMESESRTTGLEADPTVWGGSPTHYHKRIDADKQKLTEIEDRLHEQIRTELNK